MGGKFAFGSDEWWAERMAVADRAKAELAATGTVSEETMAESQRLADEDKPFLKPAPLVPTSPPKTMANLMLDPFSKPGATYNGWVIGVGVILSLVASFVVLGWVEQNMHVTSKGVLIAVSIIGFTITGWLARKR